MILVGELSLWIALLMGVWAVTTSFAGGWLRREDLIESGARGLYASVGFVGVASLGLWTALLTSDFSLRYVASFTSANLPLVYKFSAFWVGRSGSMLFWSLVLALYAAIATWTNRSKDRAPMPWVTGTNATLLVIFVAATALSANPFEHLDRIPVDGRGLDPRLQDPATAIHRPMLYLGYLATAIPFSFTVGALVTRRLDAEWLGVVRRWAVASWTVLTIGILLGMRGAYVEGGRGGNWIWDSVENASVLPWLTVTALLHTIIVQERRGTLSNWNVVLVVGSFLLSILVAVVTRSGGIGSESSFLRGTLGNWFAWSLLLALAGIGALIAWRRGSVANIRPQHSFPVFARLVSRNRRRLGGHIVHAGIVMIFAAFVGMAFKQGHDVTLLDGQSFATNDPFGREWTFTSDGISRFRAANRDVVAVAIRPVIEGRTMQLMTSEVRHQFDSRGEPSFEPSTEVGILSTMRQDVYLELAETIGDRAVVRIDFNPLVAWVWYGGMLMALGGLVVMWPSRRGAVLSLEEPREPEVPSAIDALRASDPAEEMIARARAVVPLCATCGPRPESDALFCSNCGRSLGRAAGHDDAITAPAEP